jgi:RHS repeat-associated protein
MNGYNDKRMHPAANEKTFRLPETRVWASNFGAHPFISASAWLSSTLQWGCDYSCDRTASGKLDQRFYNSVYGRFMSPDPYKQSGGAGDPGSWNRYAYVGGDPINHADPQGLLQQSGCGSDPTAPLCQANDGNATDNGGCYIDGLFSTDVLCDQFPGVGSAGPIATPPSSPPCYQDQPKITQTLTDVGANILAIFTADFDPKSSQNSLASDLTAINSVISQATNRYQGGHFNLDLDLNLLLQDLGSKDDAEFLGDFGGHLDGTRQRAVVGSSPNVLNYYLHSKEHRKSGTIDFHFDRWSGTNVTAPAHLGYDVAYGTLAHSCLDPAWH